MEFQRSLPLDPSQLSEGSSRTPDRRFSFKSACLITIALMGRCADGWHVDAVRDKGGGGDGGGGDGGGGRVVDLKQIGLHGRNSRSRKLVMCCTQTHDSKLSS